MLTIRMQRGGRKGHPQYRIVVQDSRFSPTSGRIVKQVGTYNPHTKETTIDSASVEKYLANGAQPSDRVIGILKASKVSLPSWVKDPSAKTKPTRNVGKLKRNTPVTEEASVEESTPEESSEAPETATEEAPAETPVVEESPSAE